MKEVRPDRRSFLRQAGVLGAAAGLAGAGGRLGAQGRNFHLAVNEYSWVTFFSRDGRDFKADLDAGLGEVAASGLQGYESSIGSPEDLDQLQPLLRKHNLEMRSVYVNSVLHEPSQAEKSIREIVRIGERASAAGVGILVTNPSPIRWGEPKDKDDGQLRCQADALNRLGKELDGMGLTLAYHNHDPELRQAAREFHHMMVGTDPDLVKLCLDSHWIFRGAGDSQVALMDVIRLYGGRVAEWHIRQSQGGIWTESFGDGDIDYPAVVELLASKGDRPHLVLEQAPEDGTPSTMNSLESHRRSVAYARSVLWKVAG
jgi:inosose dehydratase